MVESAAWHKKRAEDVLLELGSSRAGLSSAEAARRLELHGPNALTEQPKRSPFLIFLAQFTDFLVILLIGAGLISCFIGDMADALAIFAIVLIDAVIGFVQEQRAEKAIAALKRLAGHGATVIRDSKIAAIAASDVVPGDIVILSAGMIVPADMRIVEAFTLACGESALTGESVPTEKTGMPLPEDVTSLGDRRNMAFKETIVAHGRGVGVAVATGMGTEFGRIAAMVQGEGGKETPLQKRLALFGKKLGAVIVLISALVFVLGWLRGEPLALMLLTAVSLAVAAIPEALPAVVTISLALGAKKMVGQKALIRRLSAVETLGSVSYICSDKTGTLTMNTMAVRQTWTEGEEGGSRHISGSAASSTFLVAMALCNDSCMDNRGEIMGEPTENALFIHARNEGFNKEEMEKRFPRLAEIPFDPERKAMTTFHGCDSGVISFTKGGVEAILTKCIPVEKGDGLPPIDLQRRLQAAEKLAADGLRVLAIAMKSWERLPDPILVEEAESGLTFLGFAGLMDPPREEARDAVALCKTAGITPVMITGDHPLTARVIAEQVGILEEGGEVVTGPELEAIPFKEFEDRVERIRVYARVAPDQKMKIVRALQDRGHFVAMTGDGVNDAPALKRADIGVAMGITGTDAAKEAAAMVLLDDNFAAIVDAVREGRRIYANILKFITYSVASNAGTLGAVVMAPFLGLPLPLLPIQILWMNLLCDSLPGLALTAEQAEPDIMARPPVDPNEGVFAAGRGSFALAYGFMIGGAALLFQSYAIQRGLPWQTMIFTFLVTNRMAVALSVRSRKLSLLRLGLFSNHHLVWAIIFTLTLQMLVVYTPLLNPVFSTVPLSPWELSITFALAGGMLAVSESEKRLRRFLGLKHSF